MKERFQVAGDTVRLQSSGTFLLQILASSLSLVTRIILARLLGVVGFGRYAEVNAWTKALSIFADLGFGWLLVRSLARYQARGEWSLFRGLLRRSHQLVLVTALFGGLILVFVGSWVTPSSRYGPTAFWIAGLLFPIYMINNLRIAVLIGLRYVITAKAVALLAKGPFLLIIIGMYGVIFAGEMTPTTAITLNFFPIMLIFILYAILLRRHLPPQIKEVAPQTHTLYWLRSSLPMLFWGSMFILNTKLDMILVGMLLGPAEAGVYSGAAEWAGLVSYPIMALNVALLPHASRDYAMGNIHRLQRQVTSNLRLATGLSLVILLGLIGLGRWLLSFYGAEFIAGYGPLLILGAGQLLFTSMGTVWYLMVATLQEGVLIGATALGGLLNVVLTLLLIPRFHLLGAACATASSIFITTVVGVWLLSRRVGISSTVFNREQRDDSAGPASAGD